MIHHRRVLARVLARPAGVRAAVILAALVVTPGESIAQEAATSTEAEPAVQAMEPLAWLVGDWKGEGWIRRGPEGSIEFTQTEHVERAFGGRLLLVEGIGRTKVPGGEGPIGHHAFGILSWDPERETHRFDTHVAGGAGVDTEASVADGVVTWSFDTPNGKVRYRIRETETGQWHETGDFSPDDGESWLQFFEMTLSRVTAPTPEAPGRPGSGATEGTGR